MQATIQTSWYHFLLEEIEKPYFEQIMKQVDEEYLKNVCFPPKELIFNAFNQFEFKDLKVVIMGQDPYHGIGEANGLCFSVNDSIKIPPSLLNIFKEINLNFDLVLLPSSGNLERWAQQGVLLLNAALTVQKDLPNSHKFLKWRMFTDAVIQKISNDAENIVFLLWGNEAIQKEKWIDATKHKIFKSGHPSPMSANQGKWFGNQHFSQTNDFLKTIGKQPIEW